MLALLLDEQISPAIARELARHRPGMRVETVHRWRLGELLSKPGWLVLQAATEERLTLVTYDLKTIPPILVEWGGLGISHAGVILIDERTIATDDFRGLIRALALLWQRERHADWIDRMLYLPLA
jgi:hypothetical protein